MNKARGQCGTDTLCKSGLTGSIPARASTKHKSLAEMHWFWRYVYWPYRQVRFKYIDYPLIKQTNAFMKPLRDMQKIIIQTRIERDEWKRKYIEVSKEVAQSKRKSKTLSTTN